jgi:surface antigen
MRLFVLIIAAAFAQPALAQNWVALLKNTPAERFDKEDLRIFMATSDQALDGTPDGETLTWKNPETGHHGDITVLKSFESKGRACKDLRVRNEADGRKGDNKLNWCKADGKWRLLSASPTAKAKTK